MNTNCLIRYQQGSLEGFINNEDIARMKTLPYTESHLAFRSRLRQFLKSEVTPHVDQWEKDHMIPREIWRKMGRAGFLCTSVPEEYGGLGLDFLYSVIVNQEMARTNHAGLMAYLHSDIVVPYILSYGLEVQKKKYLPGCINGDIVTAVAMTEPDSGSDLASMSTSAEEIDGQVVINGNKTFISNGFHCDLVILAAKDPLVKSPHKAVSLYIVEDGTPGFKKGNLIEKMGMRSQDTAELFFTDCRIPKDNLLGQKGAGFVQLMKKLQQERLLVAILAVSMARNMLDWTVEYCRHALQNQEPMTKSQATRFALVEMETELKVGTAFLNDLVMAHMENEDVTAETSMAKYWCSEKANEVANRCLELVGRKSASEDCPIVRMWRDVRIHTIFAGTNEIMKNIIAKSMKL